MPDIIVNHRKSRNMLHLLIVRKITIASAAFLFAATAFGAPAASNWLLTFNLSDKGSHIIGNPAAPAKVVEYMSYTCGHCANFESNDAPQFKSQYVATGKASFEIRNLVLNPVDLTAALLARCGGKSRFFGNHKHLLATQKIWLGKASQISPATDAKLQTQDYVGYMNGVYVETGLSKIMQQRGITLTQGKACLADKAAFDAVVAMSDKGRALGVQGTPTFMINDKLDGDVHNFQALKTKLSAL